MNLRDQLEWIYVYLNATSYIHFMYRLCFYQIIIDYVLILTHYSDHKKCDFMLGGGGEVWVFYHCLDYFIPTFVDL